VSPSQRRSATASKLGDTGAARTGTSSPLRRGSLGVHRGGLGPSAVTENQVRAGESGLAEKARGFGSVAIDRGARADGSNLFSRGSAPAWSFHDVSSSLRRTSCHSSARAPARVRANEAPTARLLLSPRDARDRASSASLSFRRPKVPHTRTIAASSAFCSRTGARVGHRERGRACRRDHLDALRRQWMRPSRCRPSPDEEHS
jgi:hypothetical protein